MIEVDRNLKSPELIDYSTLVEVAERLTSMIVLVCPSTDCTRTATIETLADGSDVVRLHSEGEKEALTEILDTFGRAMHVPCPEHDRLDASQRLAAMNVVAGPDETATSDTEILRRLQIMEAKRQASPFLPKTLSKLNPPLSQFRPPLGR